MTAPSEKEDELAGTEQPFVSHLIELRDRLIRVVIALAAVFGLLCVWPGINSLYDLLAAPLTANLPPGTKLIATNVWWRCRTCSTRSGPSSRRGCTRTRSAWCCRW